MNLFWKIFVTPILCTILFFCTSLEVKIGKKKDIFLYLTFVLLSDIWKAGIKFFESNNLFCLFVYISTINIR